MLLISLCGCVERVDAPIVVDRELAAQASHWLEAGSFGGHAELAVDSDDPWERRYAPGGFELIAGVDSTASEVWVCDLGISRLQVFDYEGNLLRTLGSGIPAAGTTADDRELYEFSAQRGRTDINPFALSPAGQRWAGAEREHFLAADVAVQERGYVIADRAKTGLDSNASRFTGIVSVPFDEEQPVSRFPGMEGGWPSYVCAAGSYYAASDTQRNVVYLFAPGREEGNPFKALGGKATAFDVMSALYAPDDFPMPYQQLLLRAGDASGEPGKFTYPGGVALAFDKLLACDTGNRRLQVFEARADEEYFWGKLLRVIDARAPGGQMRFLKPRDIDVAPDGRIYLLDSERQEVVELSPTFERLGVVADGFGDAYALDISPDGNHIFVTDRGDDRVHHHVRSE